MDNAIPQYRGRCLYCGGGAVRADWPSGATRAHVDEDGTRRLGPHQIVFEQSTVRLTGHWVLDEEHHRWRVIALDGREMPATRG
jgi:hypothetical protein